MGYKGLQSCNKDMLCVTYLCEFADSSIHAAEGAEFANSKISVLARISVADLVDKNFLSPSGTTSFMNLFLIFFHPKMIICFQYL